MEMGTKIGEVLPLAAEFPSLLGADGSFRGDSPMNPQQIKEALRLMLQSRAIDALCIKMQRLGRIGIYGPVYGQEAAVVGSAMTLDPKRDWIVPASQEQPAMLRPCRCGVSPLVPLSRAGQIGPLATTKTLFGR